MNIYDVKSTSTAYWFFNKKTGKREVMHFSCTSRAIEFARTHSDYEFIGTADHVTMCQAHPNYYLK